MKVGKQERCVVFLWGDVRHGKQTQRLHMIDSEAIPYCIYKHTAKDSSTNNLTIDCLDLQVSFQEGEKIQRMHASIKSAQVLSTNNTASHWNRDTSMQRR